MQTYKYIIVVLSCLFIQNGYSMCYRKLEYKNRKTSEYIAKYTQEAKLVPEDEIIKIAEHLETYFNTNKQFSEKQFSKIEDLIKQKSLYKIAK